MVRLAFSMSARLAQEFCRDKSKNLMSGGRQLEVFRTECLRRSVAHMPVREAPATTASVSARK